jgi:cobalt-zinc-cadmium efflux system outer membrane protein
MRALAACLAIVSAPAAAAPELPPVLTVAEALRLFRARSLDLMLAEAQVAAARGDESTARAVANPLLSGSVGKSFGYDASACPGCSALGFGIGLSDQGAIFDAAEGKRGLRIDVARAALAAAQRSRDDAERTLRLALEQAVVDAALARAQLEFAGETLQFARRTQQLDEARLSAGAISEAELARAEVAALEAAQAVDVAEQAERAARAQLVALLGIAGPLPEFRIDPSLLGEALTLTAPDATADELYAEAVATRPDLRALEAQEARARSALDLARRQRLPDVTLGATYAQEGTGTGAITPPTVTASVSLPLPVFYQQQGEIARAEAELRAQHLQRERALTQLAAEVPTARSSVIVTRRLVDRMQGRLLARAQRARDLVRVQYEKGAASLLELLDAQRTFAQTHAEYLQDLHDLWLAHFKLLAAVGREPRS